MTKRGDTQKNQITELSYSTKSGVDMIVKNCAKYNIVQPERDHWYLFPLVSTKVSPNIGSRTIL